MQSLISRVAIAAGLAVVALIVATLGLAFLGAALYFWLRSRFLAPEISALIVGGAALFTALLLMLIVKLSFRRRPAPARSGTRTTTTDAAGILGQAIVREGLSVVQAHPYRTLLISVGAGFLAGAIPELRRLPASFLRRK